MSICLGIDVSKASLQVALIADTSKGRKILGTHKFSNKKICSNGSKKEPRSRRFTP